MSQPLDSDLRLGQMAIRMGVIAPHDLPALLREARAGHAEESAGGATSLAQILLRKRLLSVSDYMYMAEQARVEQESGFGGPAVSDMEVALKSFESGELDASSFQEMLGASGEPLTRPPDTTQRFGRYELLSEVARGGMGIVYRAKDPEGKIVALKVMIEADDDEVRLQRFEREAELAAALTHPGIVRIYDAGRVEGIPYFTMDLVLGDSLDDLLEGEGIERDLAISVLAQVARAADHAHERGIIHRDLKPGNILIERKTHMARITDFGLARDLSRGTRLTQVGQAVGTPYYMAPEQVRGERDVDGRCDLYAIGVILYEILTGDVPFDADSPLSLFKKIDREEVELQLDPANGIDENIHKITLRALEKDREERYSRGTLLAEDLERYLKGLPPKAQPYEWREGLRRKLTNNPWALATLGLGLMALAVLAVLGTLASRRLEDRRLTDEGRTKAEATLTAAETAESEAREALGGGDPAAATPPLERATQALEELETLLEGSDPRAQGAKDAFMSGGGESLRTRLSLLRAESLAERARDDPALGELAAAALLKAKSLAPRDVGLRRLAARFHRLRGEYAPALQELATALDLEPTDEAALTRRSELYLELGRPEEAAADLSRILLRSPNDVPALIGRAQAQIALDRLDSARSDAKNACSLAPNDAAPLIVYGDVARAEGDTTAAFSRYQRAAGLAPQDPRPHSRAGDLQLERGSYEAALDAFDRAQRLGGGWAAAQGTARAHAGLFDLKAAIDSATLALAAADREPLQSRGRARARTHTLVGEIRLAGGEEDAARRAFEEALKADPRAIAPRVWLSRLALQGSAERAAQYLADIPEGPDNADLLAARSRLALTESDLDAAESLAERAVAAAGDRSEPRARQALAMARLRRAVDDAARATCDAAWDDAMRGSELAAEFLRRARELQALGSTYRSASLEEQADELLKAVTRLDPQRVPAWATTAALLLGAGKLAPARKALERAAKHDPFSVELAELSIQLALKERSPAAFRLAVERAQRAIEFQGANSKLLTLQARCHLQLEEWELGLAALNRAARLGRSRAEVHALRAQALKALGRGDEERLAARRAKELGPERDARRSDLYRQAQALRTEEPRRALALANEALSLSDPERHPDWPALVRFVAGLLSAPEDRLESLAPALAKAGDTGLDASDLVLSKVWLRPLAAANRRRLRSATRRGGAVANLAIALAGLYDGLTGQADPVLLREALRAAHEAVVQNPASIAAHLARAYLRVHTGDPARGLRELNVLSQTSERSALIEFARAEALAALGRDPGPALAAARERGAPSLDVRIRHSEFLR